MTVVVCPAAGDEELPKSVAALQGAVFLPPAREVPWIAHTALGLRDVPGQVLLVAYGTACALVPQVGFAARAARRPVSGYVLVDGELPDAAHRSADWPDAPVTVVCDPDSDRARAATLRGWTVVDSAAAAVAEV